MRVTRQVRYAICGLFDLAYNTTARPIRVQEIGERQGVPTRYLEQIFQRLRRAGLIESKRGPGGGYALARPPSEVSVADVVVALEGAVVAPAVIGPASEGRPEFVWALLEERVAEVLASVSFADLCREAAERGLPHAETEPAMYDI